MEFQSLHHYQIQTLSMITTLSTGKKSTTCRIKKILKLKGNKCPNLIYNGHKSLDPRKMYESEGLNKKWNTF